MLANKSTKLFLQMSYQSLLIILINFKNFFRKIRSGGFYVIEDFNHYKFYSNLDEVEISFMKIEKFSTLKA